MPSLFTRLSGLLLLLLSTIHLSQAVTCHHALGRPLPLAEDCTELVDALIETARLPSHLHPKEWGRDLPSTVSTEHLPKLYWITSRPHGPTTCGVQLDVVPSEPLAVETFGLIDVGQGAEGVLELCLLRRSLTGVERLGAGKKVEARLVRVDKGLMLGGARNSTREAVWKGRVLWGTNLGLNGTKSQA